MADVIAIGSIVCSAASVAVAVAALVKSSRAQREANSAQRRIVEIEEQRENERRLQAAQASLRPELRKTGKHTYRLYLVNEGSSEARNVRVEMDGKPLAEHDAAMQNDPMPRIVGPKSEIGCVLALHFGCHPPFQIEIRWDDDSGEARSYRTTLTW